MRMILALVASLFLQAVVFLAMLHFEGWGHIQEIAAVAGLMTLLFLAAFGGLIEQFAFGFWALSLLSFEIAFIMAFWFENIGHLADASNALFASAVFALIAVFFTYFPDGVSLRYFLPDRRR